MGPHRWCNHYYSPPSIMTERGLAPDRVKPNNITLVCAASPLSITTEWEQNKVVPYSVKCARVERHVCPRNFISMNYHYKNRTKRV